MVFAGSPSLRAATAKLPARTTSTNSATSFKSSIDSSKVQVFAQIGFGQWFRFVTAGVEIAGAVALFVLSLSLAWLMRDQLSTLRGRLL